MSNNVETAMRAQLQPQAQPYLAMSATTSALQPPAPIKLVVGLGNPTSQEISNYDDSYAQTRHNIGFQVINQILFYLKSGADTSAAAYNQETVCLPNCDAQLIKVGGTGAVHGQNNVLLCKPHHINLNHSGIPVKQIMDFYGISPQEVLVIADDLDSPVGAAKLKFNVGDGGHNGLKSIQASMGNTLEFWKIKMGVGHPRNNPYINGDGDSNAKVSILDYVLGTPTNPVEIDKLNHSKQVVTQFLLDNVILNQLSLQPKIFIK